LTGAASARAEVSTGAGWAGLSAHPAAAANAASAASKQKAGAMTLGMMAVALRKPIKDNAFKNSAPGIDLRRIW
jgi:hypothetical protein